MVLLFKLTLLSSTVHCSVFDAIKLEQIFLNFSHWFTFRSGR